MPTDGRTVPGASAPALHVRTADGQTQRFVATFCIGRAVECELRIDDHHVSRRHLDVVLREGRWSVRDLNSTNGIWVDGVRVPSAPVERSLTVTLGVDGPAVTFQVEEARAARPSAPRPTLAQTGSETMLLDKYVDRYFGKGDDEDVGGRTMMIRKAFAKVQRRQRRMYFAVIGALVLIALGVGAFALKNVIDKQQQERFAREVFYQMKGIDVEIARLAQELSRGGNPAASERMRALVARRRAGERAYEDYLAALEVYDSSLTEEDQLILRVTRLFGECELAAPPEYMDLVKKYIREWQKSPRFVNAVTRARQYGYAAPIAEAFHAQNLPPQFFYLAMQESSFNEFAVGPPTRYGYAKGMWQFIKDTGQRYGLAIGPRAAQAVADPDDERHQWQKATRAAARYINDIYATDAQASGLLVMASYNWGEGNVIRLIRSLPDNPQERNFWKLLEKHGNRIPGETYNYVFMIVSAAVIGENPKLFGFPVDNPLAFTEAPPVQSSASR